VPTYHSKKVASFELPSQDAAPAKVPGSEGRSPTPDFAPLGLLCRLGGPESSAGGPLRGNGRLRRCYDGAVLGSELDRLWLFVVKKGRGGSRERNECLLTSSLDRSAIVRAMSS
jgi:hypothetical protein